jgi:hypothetical protein
MGGYIKGRGTPTSDSILLPTGNGGLIRASDTEFMQPASSVSYYGTDFMEDIRARRIPKEIISAAMGGAIPGYPDGGIVDPNKVYLPDGTEARKMSREERNANYRASRERFLASRKKYKETPLPELSAIEWARKSGAILPYAMGGAIPGYFDGGSIFSKIMQSATNPLGAGMGIGLDLLSKIDTYRKNKDLNKWVETSGDGAKWMEKKTLNQNAETIYVYDMANRYDSKDRRPIVNQALKYLTGQTGVQFKRATFGMRNNPEVVKLDWSDPQHLIDQGAAGSSSPGSRVVNLISPMGLNAFTLGRQGGQNTIAHEILHSLGIGDYSDSSPDSMFDGHAKNPFNLMFPSVGLGPTFVSKADTESLRYLTDFYNFQDKPIGKAMGGMVPGYHKGGLIGHKHRQFASPDGKEISPKGKVGNLS